MSSSFIGQAAIRVRHKKLADQEYYVWIEVGNFSISIHELFIESKDEARQIVKKIRKAIKNNDIAICPEPIFGRQQKKSTGTWLLAADIGEYEGHISLSNFKCLTKATAKAKEIQLQLEQHSGGSQE